MSAILENSDYGCVLFLGCSGSGKTYGLKQILNTLLAHNRRTPVYTINVKDVEYEGEFGTHLNIGFDQIDRIREHSLVVVEDLINLTAKEEVSLRQLVNWHAHHKHLKLFAVSHNIFKTKLFNTLAYFDFLIFTSSLSNIRILRNCMSYFQVEPEIVQKWINQIRMFKGQQGIYLIFDTKKRIFYATNNLTNSNSSRTIGKAELDPESDVDKSRDLIQKRFDLFFRGRPNSEQASAVFSILVNCLNPKRFDPVDLTMQFASREGLKKISVVDYVNNLLDSHPRQRPNSSHIVIHNYVQTHCKIPDIFLLNRHFK